MKTASYTDQLIVVAASIWGFSIAFGNQPNPGTALPYTQVDSSYYWVDDVNSAYYNQFVQLRITGA